MKYLIPLVFLLSLGACGDKTSSVAPTEAVVAAAAEQQVRGWLSTMQQLADSLAHASTELDRFAKGLNDPQGTAYALTRDTAVAGDVRRTLDQLQKSSVTLDEDLKALQRNWFLRKYFKEQEKEARKKE